MTDNISSVPGAVSPHVLPPLPFAENALEPVITAHTLSFHYGKHHKTYVDNLNKFIAGTEYADLLLEKIVTSTAGRPAGRGARGQRASTIPAAFSLSNRRSRTASQPAARYRPRWRAIVSGRAWSGQCGAVYAR